jgi:Arc/MetJ family transcription regulator
MNHRPGARPSAGSQTVLPTVRFSPATSVEFTPAAYSRRSRAEFQETLPTGDPEIKPLVGRYDLKVEWSLQPGEARALRGETQRDTLHESRPKSSEADEGAAHKNRGKRSGSKRTHVPDPLSGPRYRGSNPCLPATTDTKSIASTAEHTRNDTSLGPRAHPSNFSKSGRKTLRIRGETRLRHFTQVYDSVQPRWFDWIHTILRTLHIMRTNIDIDDGLMRQAMRTTGARTKRAAVEEGLRLLIRTRGQRSIRRLRGKVAWDGDLDESRRSRIAK